MLLFSGTHPGLFFSILHPRIVFQHPSPQNTLCSKLSLLPASCWVVICNVCNFSPCLLYIKHVYKQSMCRNQGLVGQTESSSSCWAHRTDWTPKPAAQASLLAPAVKLHLSRACDTIQINLAINVGKTEGLLSRMGGTRSFKERSLEQFNGARQPLKRCRVLFLRYSGIPFGSYFGS